MSGETDSLPGPARHSVFLVDDHPLVREWLGSLIERQPDLAVCGQADSGAAAFEAIGRLQPEVAIIDLSLQEGSGLGLIKDLQTLPNPPRVLVLSMHDENTYAERALRAGAVGYVMKRTATSQIVEAIHRILDGKLYISEAVSMQLTKKVMRARVNLAVAPISLLSDREIEIFQLLGQGLETRRIAESLHLSPKTVQVYCGRIKEKLGIENATSLIGEAVRWYEQQHRTL